jgi:hypothetical protein
MAHASVIWNRMVCDVSICGCRHSVTHRNGLRVLLWVVRRVSTTTSPRANLLRAAIVIIIMAS